MQATSGNGRDPRRRTAFNLVLGFMLLGVLAGLADGLLRDSTNGWIAAGVFGVLAIICALGPRAKKWFGIMFAWGNARLHAGVHLKDEAIEQNSQEEATPPASDGEPAQTAKQDESR